MKKIWVAESGEYDDRGVCLIGTSPQAVAEGLKLQHQKFRADNPRDRHSNGYDVDWGDLQRVNEDEWLIVAHYRASNCEYQITQYDFFDGAEVAGL